METNALDFAYNARTTYTAIKHLFSKQPQLSGIHYNDDLLYVEARRGMLLSPFSESIKVKVVATSTSSCKVVVESSSRSLLNLLNFGANSGNVSDLCDYISNEVYKLTQPNEIPKTPIEEHSTIRFKTADIKFRSR